MAKHETLPEIDIDRLVDGELSDQRRAEVLALLEVEDDGWRRCAVAFLEAQAWTESLGGSNDRRRENNSLLKGNRTSASAASRSGQNPPRAGMSWTGWLSVAAAVMIAFAMGIASERLPRRNDDPPRLASDVKPPTEHVSTASTPAEKESADGLTFVVHNDQGEPQRVNVPIVDWASGQEWLSRGSVSPHENQIRNQLRKSGNNIGRREQFFAPIETQDGRRFVVPIQRWEVVPVSSRDFQ